jgi:hypothetical protein
MLVDVAGWRITQREHEDKVEEKEGGGQDID